MSPTISLSEEAYQALEEERRDDETASEAILRLVEERSGEEKDPFHFVRTRAQRERAWSLEEHEEMLKEMDEADRRKARERREDREGES